MDDVRNEISALLSIYVVANVPKSKCKLTFGLCMILFPVIWLVDFFINLIGLRNTNYITGNEGKLQNKKESYLSYVKLNQPEKECFVIFACTIDWLHSAISIYQEN